MKTVFFIFALFLVINLAVSKVQYKNPDSVDYSFYRSFEKMHGINVDCQGNQTFTQYADCDKRCDFIDPPEDCAGATYVACACKDGYIAVDESREKCVKPEDCP
ncbi:TIL domain-containing protein [Trichonephila clavata]|uniref:TIL domain-containing protein n=1 Tax=Trichonephila clavata TaxID=2740835 RepID=A0A8X6LX99_TRICU|nr:TIL domain-containing protein [Trichonephila clavata]